MLPQWALNTSKPLPEYMGIDLCSTHIRMSQQRLYCTNITATAQQLGSKSVPESMAANRLLHARNANSLLNSALNGADVHMMADALTIFINADPA